MVTYLFRILIYRLNFGDGIHNIYCKPSSSSSSSAGLFAGKMTSETCKLEFEREVKCNPHKYYELFKYTLHHLPAVFPESYKSSEIIEGDGESVGTIRLWKYCLIGSTELMECKEKLLVVDDEKMLLVLDIYEGHLQEHYNSFVLTVQVVPKAEGGSVKWSVEYEKGGERDPHDYMDLYVMLHDKIDAHLVNKPRGEVIIK